MEVVLALFSPGNREHIMLKQAFFRIFVLIVEPDSVLLQRMRAIVEETDLPFDILAASSLMEARASVEMHRPGIILIEPDQPQGDGLEFIRWVRSASPCPHSVIACVTHQRGIRDKVAGFQAGADDYIIKPVDPVTFPYRLVLLQRLRHLSSQ